jgi:hypothetical protein
MRAMTLVITLIVGLLLLHGGHRTDGRADIFLLIDTEQLSWFEHGDDIDRAVRLLLNELRPGDSLGLLMVRNGSPARSPAMQHRFSDHPLELNQEIRAFRQVARDEARRLEASATPWSHALGFVTAAFDDAAPGGTRCLVILTRGEGSLPEWPDTLQSVSGIWQLRLLEAGGHGATPSYLDNGGELVLDGRQAWLEAADEAGAGARWLPLADREHWQPCRIR